MQFKYRSVTVRIVRYFWRQWRDELTPAGKCLVWGICVTGLGTITLQVPIYQLFCGLVALLAVGAMAGFVLRPRVAIQGDLPELVTAGRPVTATFTLRNLRRRLPAYDVGLAIFGLPESFSSDADGDLVPRLGPGETAALPVSIVPKRRGRYQLPDLRAYSVFPFYLGRSGKSAKPLSPLLVLPSFEPLGAFALPVGSRHQPGGITLTARVGESPEYIGNRDYGPGEPVRRLDFRAWARTGKPVVREYQEEYYSRVALVLDTFVAPGRRPPPGGFADFEAAVSLTAAVAESLSHGEYVIDLFAAGPELHVFRSGRHTASFEQVLRILAGVEPSRSDPFESLGPAVGEELSQVSTVVLVMLGWSESRRRLCERAIQAGCRIKPIFVVRDARSVPRPQATDRAGLRPTSASEDMADALAELPDAIVLTPSQIARGGLELR